MLKKSAGRQMAKDWVPPVASNVINNCRTERFDSNIAAVNPASEFFNTICPAGTAATGKQ
jgi:hypothetical protein